MNLGIEVEGVESVGEITGPLVIGRVVEIEETRAGARPDDEDEVARMRRGCRMVVEWPA